MKEKPKITQASIFSKTLSGEINFKDRKDFSDAIFMKHSGEA